MFHAGMAETPVQVSGAVAKVTVFPFVAVRFCNRRRDIIKLKMKRVHLPRILIFCLLLVNVQSALCALADHSIVEFPRMAGETDDAPRFQRAIDACACSVLSVPSGEYTLSRTVVVTNLCSIELSASAYVKATARMDWMIRIDALWQYSPKTAPKGVNAEVYNLFYRGGTLDANGLASCLAIDNYRHFTLENATFLNGRKYGVGIETKGLGYELMARNLYIKTLIPGLAGNTGLYTYGGDSHYTDIVVVDCTTGVHFAGRGSNRLTRIHVWGGSLKPVKPGELREMLKNSVCFRIDSSSEILRDCYADTGEIGFWINGWEDRMFGCSYHNNTGFKMKDVTIIRQDRGTLWTDGNSFHHQTAETRLYRGGPDAKIHWGENTIYSFCGGRSTSKPPSFLPTIQPYNIDRVRQLFLEDAIFESNTAKRVWNRPVKNAYLPDTQLPCIGDWKAFYNPITRYWEYVSLRNDDKGPYILHTEDSELFTDPTQIAAKPNVSRWFSDVLTDDFVGGGYEGVMIGFMRNLPKTMDAGAYRFGFLNSRRRWTFPAPTADGFKTSRQDGFCSVKDGMIITRPLVFTVGDRLFVNVETGGGEIEVTAENLSGQRIGERRIGHDVDSTHYEVFRIPAHKPFRLRFTLRDDARIYSFAIGNGLQ